MTEEKKEIQLSAGMKSVVETLEKLTVLELSDLVKALEEKFGVSAAAPIAMAGMPMAQGGGGAVQAEGERRRHHRHHRLRGRPGLQ